MTRADDRRICEEALAAEGDWWPNADRFWDMGFSKPVADFLAQFPPARVSKLLDVVEAARAMVAGKAYVVHTSQTVEAAAENRKGMAVLAALAALEERDA